MRIQSLIIFEIILFVLIFSSGYASKIHEAKIESLQINYEGNIRSNSTAGKLFDRFIIIWLENTNEKTAASSADLRWLAERGVTLTNYWALTHPSEPNYIASVGGDTFGLDKDSFVILPSNVSSVVDLLEEGGITWAEYQEDLPYSGFEGLTFSKLGNSNSYVRKHNPLISYGSITNNSSRLSKIKNFTEFHHDLNQHSLPQWMFITPNMANDGHDTNIGVSGNWCKRFLQPMLDNEYFMKNTLILITFDENESYDKKNKVWALLLGGAIDKSHFNTSDNTYYTHYSELSTIENNWSLHTLGRNDTNINGNANVFQVVAQKSGYANKYVDTANQYFNKPISGYFSEHRNFPGINCSAIGSGGKGVLTEVKRTWCSNQNSINSFNSSQASRNTSSNNTCGDIMRISLYFILIIIFLY